MFIELYKFEKFRDSRSRFLVSRPRSRLTSLLVLIFTMTRICFNKTFAGFEKTRMCLIATLTNRYAVYKSLSMTRATRVHIRLPTSAQGLL